MAILTRSPKQPTRTTTTRSILWPSAAARLNIVASAAHEEMQQRCPHASTLNPSTGTFTWLTNHFEYYDTGTVYKSYDVNGAITTYKYPDANSTCGNAFATGFTLPITGLSILASTTWNCVGAVASQ